MLLGWSVKISFKNGKLYNFMLHSEHLFIQKIPFTKVEVVDCPDLREWGVAGAGLGGATRLLDIGGVPYLMPLVMRDKLYDMKDYPGLTGLKEGLVIGAGAGPWPYINR